MCDVPALKKAGGTALVGGIGLCVIGMATGENSDGPLVYIGGLVAAVGFILLMLAAMCAPCYAAQQQQQRQAQLQAQQQQAIAAERARQTRERNLQRSHDEQAAAAAAAEKRVALLEGEQPPPKTRSQEEGVAQQKKIKPHKWCVSPKQLEDFLSEVEREFPDSDPNAHDVTTKIIRPQTQAGAASWALKLNPHGLDIRWFISHSWDEPVKQFCRDVLNHLRCNGGGNVWICFLANPQTWHPTELNRLLGEMVHQSPFALAMREAEKFLVVRNSRVNLYTRLWCVYERVLAHDLTESGSLPPSNLSVIGPATAPRDKTREGLAGKCSNPEDARKILSAIQEMAGGADIVKRLVNGILDQPSV